MPIGFVRAALAKARSLAHTGEAGALVAEVGDNMTRETYVYRYRMIYEVVGQSVRSLAFIHGARDLRQLWDDDARRTGESSDT